MSLTASRVGLRHLCTIQRDANADAQADEWGQQPSPDWQAHITDQPCRAWTNAAREPTDADRSIVVEDRRLSIPVGVDVTETDRVSVVTDQAGNTVFPGPMDIEGVLRYGDHVELLLKQVR